MNWTEIYNMIRSVSTFIGIGVIILLILAFWFLWFYEEKWIPFKEKHKRKKIESEVENDS